MWTTFQPFISYARCLCLNELYFVKLIDMIDIIFIYLIKAIK